MENLAMSSEYLLYYKGKKVFITGHTGFKGSWLAAILQTAGAIIKGYALAPEYDGLFSLIEKECFSENVIADIRDKNRLKKEVESFKPDLIIHMAAQPLVRRSYQIPAETFEVNVAGTANLLEIVRDLNHKCSVIVITTDKVYENKETGQLYREEDPLGGYDPYSSSKACTELVVSSFRNSFFNPMSYDTHLKAIASARAGNVIGGGDWSTDRIIPDIIRSLQGGTEIKVRNPNSVRPWQHVLEPLSGYLMLGRMLDLDPLNFSKPFNFGPLPEDHLSVEELVKTAITCWGKGDWIDMSDTTQVHEAGLLKLDISRAKEDLQWLPKMNAKQAIMQTVEWYRKPVERRMEFTFQQIKEYFTT